MFVWARETRWCRLFQGGLVLLTLLGVNACTLTAAEPERFEFEEQHMGMPFRIVLYAESAAIANDAAKAAFSRIEALNLTLSDYEPESEVNRLSATAGTGQKVPLSHDLRTILLQAQELSQKSDGAFDVTIGPAVRLWRQARRKKVMPKEADLKAAAALVDFRQLQFGPENKTVEMLRKGQRIDLGGIAVGYAVDEAMKILKDKGITSALLDGSGDIAVSLPPPGEAGWKIGVAPSEQNKMPTQYLLLTNAAVTTSGDAFQFVELGGKRYSHIVDPRTGLGLTDRLSATVVAPTCIVADSYATAACILGLEKGSALIDSVPEAAVLIVRQTAEGVDAHRTHRWVKYVAPAAK